MRHIRSVLWSEECQRLAQEITELAPSNENVKLYSFFPAGLIKWALPLERRIDRLNGLLIRHLSGYFLTRKDSRFDWHTDAQYDGDLPGVTVWIPLQDCGVDRPSLETQEGKHVCKAGDALLFSSFERHRTFIPEGLVYPDRISAVFRYRPLRYSSWRNIAKDLSRRILQ